MGSKTNPGERFFSNLRCPNTDTLNSHSSTKRGPSASTGEHCICIVSDLLWLGLAWSCFVFCLLFLLCYVICAPVLTEGTTKRMHVPFPVCLPVLFYVSIRERRVALPQGGYSVINVTGGSDVFFWV